MLKRPQIYLPFASALARVRGCACRLVGGERVAKFLLGIQEGHAQHARADQRGTRPGAKVAQLRTGEPRVFALRTT